MAPAASAFDPMPAAITIEPAAGHAFGDFEVGKYTFSRSVGIRSAGVSTLVINSIGFAGADPGDFAMDTPTPCPHEMEATTSCSFPIYFAPTSVGPKSAILEVDSNSFSGKVSIPVSGTGTPAVIPPPPAPRASFIKKPKPRIVTKKSKLKRLAVTFRSDQAGSTFSCRLDGGTASACRSPKIYKNLKPGRHTIVIQATKNGKTGRAASANFKVVRQR